MQYKSYIRLLNALEHFLTMFDNSIDNEPSPEANWNRQTGHADRQAGRRTGLRIDVLS